MTTRLNPGGSGYGTSLGSSSRVTRGHRLAAAVTSLLGAAAGMGLPVGTAVAGAGIGIVTGVVTGVQPAQATVRPELAGSLVETWTQSLPDTGNPVALSSPTVAQLPGGPAAVVGDRDGYVWALYLASGNVVPGWPYSTGGIPVDSPPSVDPDAGNGEDTVYFGAGNAADPAQGGYYAVQPDGAVQWFQYDNGDPTGHRGVQAGLAVGDLQGQPDVVAGSLGQAENAFNANNGDELAGFPWFEADSNFTTPAIADLYSNGQNEIVEGGDSTYGNAYQTQYYNGGHLRILSATGNLGSTNPSSGLICEYNTDQVVQSSPAVGQFLAGGGVGITFGTGTYYAGAGNTNMLITVDSHCNLQWADTLDGATGASPALADVLGNGQLDVLEGTSNGAGGGSLWALNGTNGATIWRTSLPGEVLGSVATADLSGAGYQDAIVPTTAGTVIVDGQSGQIVDTIGQYQAFQNTPLVTDDPNGDIGITIAGYNGLNQGVVDHYELENTGPNSKATGAEVDDSGAWPMFHHDPQLTGTTPIAPPGPPPCLAGPSHPSEGYWLLGADGGIFNFGTAGFHGSMGGSHLNSPIVGMAPAPGGGYWEVAADGGIFAFEAGFDGSMGGAHLNAPIVGMAATPDGGGYWLVASDGGIFAFGDAHFDGSMGGSHLNAPIVGIAATPDGDGYWEVASDGGIFAFGDAAPHFYGSMGGSHLNAPIVGIAPTADGDGYWEVASDGGIFAFGEAGSHFYGSMGGSHLNAPIVGMATTAGSNGYWEVGSDGGIFGFGNATFEGSTGCFALSAPIVAMAA